MTNNIYLRMNENHTGKFSFYKAEGTLNSILPKHSFRGIVNYDHLSLTNGLSSHFRWTLSR